MREVQAPAVEPQADLFLAGGIMGAHNWQPDAVDQLKDVPGVVYNPRRSQEFTPDMHRDQVVWEYNALHNSKAILFWFPPETLCPITLYELGVWSQHKEVPIFVGTHPDYKRRTDVIIQLSLARQEVTVHATLEETIKDFIEYYSSQETLNEY